MFIKFSDNLVNEAAIGRLTIAEHNGEYRISMYGITGHFMLEEEYEFELDANKRYKQLEQELNLSARLPIMIKDIDEETCKKLVETLEHTEQVLEVV